MKKLGSFLWGMLPAGRIKNRIGCVLYNLRGHPFRMRFLQGVYVVSYAEFELRFESNPYHLLSHNCEYTRFYEPRRGDVVIDAGAFVGTFGLYCAKLVGPEGRVFCFEPDPDTYGELCRNIALNHLKNVVAMPKGLWSSETVLAFQADASLGSTFLPTQHEGLTIEVPVTTLDALADQQAFRRLDFIKMDIEGAEIEAIRGASKSLKKFDVHLAIASYHIVAGQQTFPVVEAQLATLGLNPHTVHDRDEIVTFC